MIVKLVGGDFDGEEFDDAEIRNPNYERRYLTLKTGERRLYFVQIGMSEQEATQRVEILELT